MIIPKGTPQSRPTVSRNVFDELNERHPLDNPSSVRTHHVISRIFRRAYVGGDPNQPPIELDESYMKSVRKFCGKAQWITDVEMTAFDDMMAILVENGWHPYIIELAPAKFTNEIHGWCNEHVGRQFWHDSNIVVLDDTGAVVQPALTKQMLDAAMWMVCNRDNTSLVPLFAFRRAEDAFAFKIRWC